MARTKKFLSTKAVNLIKKMMVAVTAEQGRTINQSSFPQIDHYTSDKVAVCGTSFCAAGHLILVKSPRLFNSLIKQEAKGLDVYWNLEAGKVLGIDSENPEGFFLYPIFGSAFDWPEKYKDMYYKEVSQTGRYSAVRKRRNKQHLKAFIARWTQIIETDGADIQNFLAERYMD